MSVSDDISAAIEQRMREMAAAGMTRHEAAEATGWGYGAVHRYAKKFGIEFAKMYRLSPAVKSRIDERADDFERRFRNGETLAAIGAEYGLTRERVRQVLVLRKGIDRTDGGAFARANQKRAKVDSRREGEAWAKWGCSRADYLSLLQMGKDLSAKGVSRERQPIGAFIAQKRTAKMRGIAWGLTLWQWWTIWQESGRWEERGRGSGYMMCRKGDAGGYTADNVFIATGRHNSSCQSNRENRPPTGVSEIRPGRYTAVIMIDGKTRRLGIYPTPEQAHAAYLTALADFSLGRASA
jgi:hypothetical protein